MEYFPKGGPTLAKGSKWHTIQIWVIDVFLNTFLWVNYNVIITMWSIFQKGALRWQKEASDIPSKSELLMFLYFTCLLMQELAGDGVLPSIFYVILNVRKWRKRYMYCVGLWPVYNKCTKKCPNFYSICLQFCIFAGPCILIRISNTCLRCLED